MKRILTLSLVALVTFFVSCSKSNEDDGSKTYVTITNHFGTPLSNLTIGVLRGSSKTELVKNIGMLDQNEVSDKIEVKQKDTDAVMLFFDHYNGKTYMIMQPYNIVQGSSVNLEITSIVNTTEISKTSELYPK